MSIFFHQSTTIPSVAHPQSSHLGGVVSTVNGGAKKGSQKRGLFLRTTTVLFLILAGGMSVVLFTVKYQVRDLEARQDRLVRELDDERLALHVLRAEWANLNDPKRIQTLAEQYLHMRPILPSQVMGTSGVLNIPIRDEIQPVPEDVIHEIP